MAAGALEAVRSGLRLPPAVVAAGGTPEAVRPSDGDEPPGAGVVVGEQALEGDEAGGDFGHGTVPRQECHANIPSSDISDTMPCVAGAMCISNLLDCLLIGRSCGIVIESIIDARSPNPLQPKCLQSWHCISSVEFLHRKAKIRHFIAMPKTQ